ncbi:zinc finger domain-containing protein [uncultured Desulfovibrio sp.]
MFCPRCWRHTVKEENIPEL